MSLRAETDRIAKTKFRYNLIPTIFWSLLGFTPIGYFCYAHMELFWLYVFLAVSLATLLLPDSFFPMTRLSNKISVYKRIGIRITKKLTQDGDLVNRSIQHKFPNQKIIQTQTTFKAQLSRSYFNEKIHFTMFVFFLFTTIYAIYHDFILWACVMTFTNILFNLYPIFLQQYNRLRIQGIAKRRASW